MKQDQFTWNWYPWLLVHHSQWTILEPLYYSSFVFATLVSGVIGINCVDHFLNQGAPAEHKSAETPIGHESPACNLPAYNPDNGNLPTCNLPGRKTTLHIYENQGWKEIFTYLFCIIFPLLCKESMYCFLFIFQCCNNIYKKRKQSVRYLSKKVSIFHGIKAKLA